MLPPLVYTRYCTEQTNLGITNTAFSFSGGTGAAVKYYALAPLEFAGSLATTPPAFGFCKANRSIPFVLGQRYAIWWASPKMAHKNSFEYPLGGVTIFVLKKGEQF